MEIGNRVSRDSRQGPQVFGSVDREEPLLPENREGERAPENADGSDPPTRGGARTATGSDPVASRHGLYDSIVMVHSTVSLTNPERSTARKRNTWGPGDALGTLKEAV